MNISPVSCPLLQVQFILLFPPKLFSVSSIPVTRISFLSEGHNDGQTWLRFPYILTRGVNHNLFPQLLCSDEVEQFLLKCYHKGDPKYH